MFDTYLKAVTRGELLDFSRAYEACRVMLKNGISEVKAAALLAGLRTRGESTEELQGFVQAIMEEALIKETPFESIDTCGTGGDGLGTFNISTVTALVVAAAGVPVAKHGNRAATGNVGSADVLEALGLSMDLSADKALMMLEKTGFTFLYAPYYHPIMKQVAPLRKELGVSTIFNFLGPLLNPFKPIYQIIGVSDGNLQVKMAEVLATMGAKRTMVIYAENGMDEISPIGVTRIVETSGREISSHSIDAQNLGIDSFAIDYIRGGSIENNCRIILDVLEGKPGAPRETVLLNSAAALVTAGRAEDYREGISIAAEAIDSGRAGKVLKQAISFSRDGVVLC